MAPPKTVWIDQGDFLDEIVEEQSHYVENREQIKRNDFQISDIIDNRIHIICGRLGCGKTNLVKYLVSELDKSKAFSKIIVISGNPSHYSKASFSKKMDVIPIDVHESFLKDLHKIRVKQVLDYPNTPQVCVLFDDFIGCPKYKPRSAIWTELSQDTRHMHCTFIYSTQSIQSLPIVVKDLASYWYIFQQARSVIQEHLHGYVNSIANKFHFQEIVAKCTERRFSFLLIQKEHDNIEEICGMDPIPLVR